MKKKNLLNSLTRFALALVVMFGMSLSSFAQTSGGFNYQAAIDPSYSTVDVEWTIGTYNGTVTGVAVTNGIFSAVIGAGVDYTTLAGPVALTITIKNGAEVLGTSTQELVAVPYADFAKNVFIDADGKLVVNGTKFPGMSLTPTYTNVTVMQQLFSEGTGVAQVTDDYASTDAAIKTRGGIYADGESFFNAPLNALNFRIYNGLTNNNLINGIGDTYPLSAVDPSLTAAYNVNYLPSYEAMRIFGEVLKAEILAVVAGDYVTVPRFLDSISALQGRIDVNAANIAINAADIAANAADIAANAGEIANLYHLDSLGLQHAYDMGNEIVTTSKGGVVVDGDALVTGQAAFDASLHTVADSTFAVRGVVQDTIWGTLAGYYNTRYWAGYFQGDVNINGDLLVGGTTTMGDLTVENLQVNHSFTADIADFDDVHADNAYLNHIEATEIEATTTHTFSLNVGQYHSPHYSVEMSLNDVDFYKPVYFHDAVYFLGPIGKINGDSLIFNYGQFDTLVAPYGNITELHSDDLFANNLHVDNIDFTDTIFAATEQPFSVVNIDMTDMMDPAHSGYTAVLGASATMSGSGFGYADAAVTGYEKTFLSTQKGLGTLGAKVFNITNADLLSAFGLTSGDDKIFAGFFVGDVAINGRLAANTGLFQAVGDASEYKTLDVDYTAVGGNGFTSILGGTAPNPSLGFTSADAAVAGYEKTFTSTPANSGLGVLGAKVWNITNDLMIDAFGLTSGDDKIFAGFFVGDVVIDGKLAGRQAAFYSTTTDMTYKSVDVDYTSAATTSTAKGFTAILGGSNPATGYTTDFAQADAAVVGYDKYFLTDHAKGGLGVLGARIYDIPTTSVLYTKFGPSGNNSLVDGDDKILAGLFVGDVVIDGDVLVKGMIIADGGSIVNTYHYTDNATFIAAMPASDYPEGTLVVVEFDSPSGFYLFVQKGGLWKQLL